MKRYRIVPNETTFYYSICTIINWIPVFQREVYFRIIIALKSGKWFNQKLQYIHANPVRKGFVEKPEAWKYSSARNWLLNDHGIIKIMKLDSEYTCGAEAP